LLGLAETGQHNQTLGLTRCPSLKTVPWHHSACVIGSPPQHNKADAPDKHGVCRGQVRSVCSLLSLLSPPPYRGGTGAGTACRRLPTPVFVAPFGCFAPPVLGVVAWRRDIVTQHCAFRSIGALGLFPSWKGCSAPLVAHAHSFSDPHRRPSPRAAGTWRSWPSCGQSNRTPSRSYMATTTVQTGRAGR
jgi:hypothetical protein